MNAPFSLSRLNSGGVTGRLFELARPALETALAFPALNRIYDEASRPTPPPSSFSDRALGALGVGWSAPPEDIGRIPRSGALVVVANHPFGGVDGLVLLSLLGRVRPDVRLVGNYLLDTLPALRPLLLRVDPFGGPAGPARSVAGLRAALRWVRDGGALALFPAGEVAHLRLAAGGVVEPAWSAAAVRLVRKTGAPVLPVFFAGRNSALFQAAGLVHPRLRTALLPREMLRLEGTVVQVRVGSPITPERLAAFEDDAGLAAYLKVRTGLLRARCGPASAAAPGAMVAPGSMVTHGAMVATGVRAALDVMATHGAAAGAPAAPGATAAAFEPIAPAVDPGRLAAEIDAVPREQVLLESGANVVLCTRGDRQPEILREIGRLREIAFRAAGEGTGRALDLDRFDRHYLHLFVWNRDRRAIDGAYRLGPTDEIVPRHGLEGLYTTTLFRYRRRLLDEIAPALELGRSFVRPERQKDHAPLTLLWKGIGAYVAAHPRYRMLFGPVSISNEYRSLSRDILMAFLRATRFEDRLARLVRARHPAAARPGGRGDSSSISTVVRSLDDVDDLLREIESDRKGVPVLLRQYLRLNAVLLGFNVDPDFSDVLDGLVLVDLTRVERPILARFMGRVPAESFLAWHARGASPLNRR